MICPMCRLETLRPIRRRRVTSDATDCDLGRCWHWDHVHHYPRGGKATTRTSYAPAMLRGMEVPQVMIAA